jgi:peptidoglycan/LPS O-acetylase OafA/YrhL
VSQREHLPALDGVRGIAILWVVLHNFSVVDSGTFHSLPGHALAAFLSAGWSGVTLFFVLSGFLITGILLDSQKSPHYFRNFYVRRVLRIFPLYYTVLAIAFLLWPLLAPMPSRLAEDAQHQAWLWTYLSNWVMPYDKTTKVFPHFWSLAVEEQFYLLWPFLLYRLSPRAVVRLCLGVAVVSLAAREWMTHARFSTEALYTFSVARMDALALGGAAAAALRVTAWRDALLRAAPKVAAAGGLLLLVTAVVDRGLPRIGPITLTYGDTLVAVSFTLLVLGAASADLAGLRGAWLRPWRSASLATLAKYSYGMYVLHKLLADAFGKPLMASLGPEAESSVVVNLLYLALALFASLAAAVLSYHLVEQRFLRLKPVLAGARPIPGTAPAGVAPRRT